MLLKDWVDATIVLLIVLGSAILSFVQEYNASNATQKLQAQVSHVRQVLTDLASHHPLVQEVSGCRVMGIDDNGVTFSLQAWCGNRANTKIVETDLLEQINEAFEKQKIVAPQAIQTVRLIK